MSPKTLDKIYLIGVTDGQIDGSTTAPQSRGSSPPRRGPQGFNMISSRPTTAPQSRGSSPPRRGVQGFNMISSRSTTPNVFDSANRSNPPVNTGFTGGPLSNAPILLPGHNFSSGAPASSAGDVNIVSPPRGRDRSDAIMSSPPRDGDNDDTTMSSPGRTRDEERAAHNAPLAARLLQAEQERQRLRKEREERELREHEQRKAEAARRHEELLQGDRDYALGNFEPDEPANAAMDTTPNNTASADANMGNTPDGNPPVDDNMDTEPTGTSPTDAEMVNSPGGNATPAPTSGPTPSTPDGLFSPLVSGSAREHAFLRTLLGNENGAYDEIYRNRNYVNADALDDGGEPVFY